SLERVSGEARPDADGSTSIDGPSSGDGGGGDDAPVGVEDGGSDGSRDGAFKCGSGTWFRPRPVCCAPDNPDAAACRSIGEACASITLECDDVRDCAGVDAGGDGGPAVCCLESDQNGLRGVTCKAPALCKDQGNVRVEIFCDPNAGGTCTTGTCGASA